MAVADSINLFSLSNGLLFLIVISLFGINFSKSRTKQITNVYAIMTVIFACVSLATVFFKLQETTPTFNIAYLVGFLINVMLGMITLYYMQYIKLLEGLTALFLAGLCAIVYYSDKVGVSTNNAAKDTVDSDMYKFIELNMSKYWNPLGSVNWNANYSSKFNVIFEAFYKLSDIDTSNIFMQAITSLWWFFLLVVVKLPMFAGMAIVWILSGLMQGFSAIFGVISSKSTPPTTPQSTAPSTIPMDAIKWIAILGIFMIFVVSLYASQDKMRQTPMTTLAVFFVMSLLVLGFIRFFKYEIFTKSFLACMAGLFMIGLYVYNPYNIFNMLTGVNIFAIFVLFFGICAMIYLSAKEFSTPPAKPTTTSTTTPTIKTLFETYFSKVIAGGAGLLVSAALIGFLVASIGSMQSSDGEPSVGVYILNTLIVVGMLTILFNVLDSNRTVRDSPTFKLIISIILYIPCLLSDLADLFMSEYHKTKYLTLIIIVLEIIFIIVYWLLYPRVITKIYTGGGKVLLDTPISLNKEKTVGYYKNLTGGSVFLDKSSAQTVSGANENALKGKSMNVVSGTPMVDLSGNPIIIKDISGNYVFPETINTYKYGISFWVYINPMPSYGTKPMQILNYGNNPLVQYTPQNNTLTVSAIKDSSCRDTKTTIPVYSNSNFPLQTWVNIVLNYTGGHLDIFLNSALVQTSTDVINCVHYDALVVGQKEGLNGKMCNLIYFSSPLDIITIHNMYNLTKIKEIPNIPKQDLFSI